MAAVKTDFKHFDEKGLKSVLNRFKKNKLPVDRVEATNKPKREAGYQVKTAHLIFGDGQKVTIKAKADGDIYQVKLNNKVLPIKHEGDMGKAVDEVADFVQKNAAKFAKNKAKRDAKIGAEPKVKIPKVRTALPDLIKTAQADLEGTKTANTELDSKKSEISERVTGKQGELAELQETLSAEEAEVKTLESELKELQEA